MVYVWILWKWCNVLFNIISVNNYLFSGPNKVYEHYMVVKLVHFDWFTCYIFCLMMNMVRIYVWFAACYQWIQQVGFISRYRVFSNVNWISGAPEFPHCSLHISTPNHNFDYYVPCISAMWLFNISLILFWPTYDKCVNRK